jgi:hypothetical protein
MLRRSVQDLAQEGRSKSEISQLLERFLNQARMGPDFPEVGEDALMDILDALTGWCRPSAELLPEKPTR